MEKIYYVRFEHIINNTMTFEYYEYQKSVMGSIEFEGTREEFENLKLRAQARRNLVEKELI